MTGDGAEGLVARREKASIDLVIATHKRPSQLQVCLRSIERALPRAGAAVNLRVIVVDNDVNRSASRALQSRPPGFDLEVLHEPITGKSRALNRALEHVNRDLVAFIDDDEELDPDWFRTVTREFSDHAVSFIGGPYHPVYAARLPEWIPDSYPAALGDTSSMTERTRFEAASGPVLMGGNAVVRRTVQQTAGEFRLDLGPGAGRRQRTGEDYEMFLRYLEAGAVGWFVPELKVLHHIPEQRLTKRFFREFVRQHAAAQAMLDHLRPAPVARLFGQPRYRFGNALRALARLPFENSAALRFQRELEVLEWYAFFREHRRESTRQRFTA